MKCVLNIKNHEFSSEQLRDLFLFVEWSSGHYSEKLAFAPESDVS